MPEQPCSYLDQADTAFRPCRQDAWLAGLLLVIAFVVFAGAFDHAFLVNWDDAQYVVDNPDIKGVTLENLKKVFSEFYVGNYAPLQMLSYMVDYAVWGLDPFGFILQNIALHAANGLLLYLLFRVLCLPPVPAFFGVLVFILHPVQVESVVWISQRKNVLAVFFLLQSLVLYLWSVRPQRGRWLCYGLSCLTFCCALLVKSVAVVLPGVLLAYDLFLREKRPNLFRIFVEKLPFVLLALAFAGLALVSQDPDAGGGMAREFHGGSAYATFLTMLTVYGDYLVNIFWPTGLSAAYAPEVKLAIDGAVALCGLLLLATFFAPRILAPEGRPMGRFFVVLFLFGLLPVSQIVPIITLMNDRYLYVPFLGVAGFAALLFREGLRQWGRTTLAASALAVTVLAVLTIGRVEVWQSAVTLWEDATRKQEESAVAWFGLGEAYQKEEEYGRAIDSYLDALSIDEKNPETYFNLWYCYVAAGNYAESVRTIEKAIRTLGGSGSLYVMAGHGHYFLGDYVNARVFYETALRSGADPVLIYSCLSLLAYKSGDLAGGGGFYQKALENGGSQGGIYLAWARLDSLKNTPESAVFFLERALRYGTPAAAELLEKHPDFRNLRDDERFSGLFGDSPRNTTRGGI